MSYDLMVFSAAAAPRDRQFFMKWYEQKMEADTESACYERDAAAPELVAWMKAMTEVFPVGEPLAISDKTENRVASYWMDTDLICISFPWNFAEDAYFFTRKFAEKYKVGFFDVSADEGDIIFPARTLIVE
ncbi:hypothetical protein [Taibaiella soli]|uniref:Uncharacterized protein n=1 Tax=Taibaiella soli TaxID=1649169 RepID=A0A2W2ACA7_9BACT|nr:hypothetical protein [Taibaiella soli]PZF71252.1 hypothetical protein DN068_18310 [Taibaiella soli]